MHTKSSMLVADIIMNGENRIDTLYGSKTKEGIADMIERNTNLQELMDCCEQSMVMMNDIQKVYGEMPKVEWLRSRINNILKTTKGEV